MRLWSVRFDYLDNIGLIALWREALLAKSVLELKTKGYKNHPQLIRFKNFKYPLKAINTYLFYIFKESEIRNFNFDLAKIEYSAIDLSIKIPITQGQLNYELNLIKFKLKKRTPKYYEKIKDIRIAQPNDLFYATQGEIEIWEKVKNLSF